MHLLLILLQQLLGMLPNSKQAPQGEVVRKRQPNDTRSEPDAFARLGLSQDGWMTTLPGRVCAEEIPSNPIAVRRREHRAALFSPLSVSAAVNGARTREAAGFGRVGMGPALSSEDQPAERS